MLLNAEDSELSYVKHTMMNFGCAFLVLHSNLNISSN
jgi:hypothetical protein